MKTGVSKLFTTALKITVSVGALVYVFSKIDADQILEIAKNTNYLFIIAALVSFILSKAIAALRLNRFFKATGIYISALYNFKLYLLGMFYNLFLPGGIGGDGYKIYLLNRIYNIKGIKIFWAVFFDRLSGVIGLFCLSMVLAGFIDLGLGFNHRYYAWILVPVSLLVFYLLIRMFFNHFTKEFHRVIFLSFAVQLLQTLCAFLILKAIGGSEDIMKYLFLFLISSIVAMLPITIGGVGSREITFLYGSVLLNLNEHVSIALSLIFYLITLFTSFWGIIYSIRTTDFEKKDLEFYP